MQLLIFLVGGFILLLAGLQFRRRQPRPIELRELINLVFIAFGVALAFAEGVLPSIWLTASIGLAQIRGQPTENLEAHLMPGTNIGEMVRAAVIGTLVAQVFAIKAYVDACRGAEPRPRSRQAASRSSRPPSAKP